MKYGVVAIGIAILLGGPAVPALAYDPSQGLEDIRRDVGRQRERGGRQDPREVLEQLRQQEMLDEQRRQNRLLQEELERREQERYPGWAPHGRPVWPYGR